MFKKNVLLFKYHLEKQFSSLEMGFGYFSLFYLSLMFHFLTALLFGGKDKGSPSHRKHIGSINPNCNVVEVIQGKYLISPFRKDVGIKIVEC